MISRYAGGERGARSAARAGSVLVAVDAFRASTTVALLVSRGVRVIPVSSIREAAAVRADLRIGERASEKVAGFDFGNSPTEISAAHLPAGGTAAMSTTNGTRIIEAGLGAAAIYTGAFVNAGCLASEIHTRFPDSEIVVVGCGWEGRRASEDESAAGALIHRLGLLGAELDPRARRMEESYLRRPFSNLWKNSAARRLLRLGHEDDIELCLRQDSIPAAPRLLGGKFTQHKDEPPEPA
ncbi:2-phosphosulfolactate phosphatase [Rubrobacter aplysinae]|uniref:2-phosphosulfolactate phosphatase n=1 Tax=Rubrobacter aplysinae TaxID=909625 RepID=UPI00069FF27E|nr:2-phosphosulfolactate phosphatase [Rubrobacter aplysinae]